MQYHLILTDGGVGDLICELVAVDYCTKNAPDVHFHIWTPDYLCDFAKHVLRPGNHTIRPFSKAKSKFKHGIEGRTTEWHTHHTAMRTHPVDYGFHMLCDRHLYNLNEKNYLQINPDKIDIERFDLPNKYVCLVATAAEPVKQMPAETLQTLINYVKSKGYTPVFLGKEKSTTGFKDMTVNSLIISVDYSLGINLCNKTNLLEAAKIMHNAKCVIGMDGGLIHLAGCTDAEIVAGYTLASPTHLAPIRNGSQTYKFHAVEPDLDVPDRYYQTHNNSFTKEDMRKFNNWQKVVESMTADKFIKVLDTIL